MWSWLVKSVTKPFKSEKRESDDEESRSAPASEHAEEPEAQPLIDFCSLLEELQDATVLRMDPLSRALLSFTSSQFHHKYAARYTRPTHQLLLLAAGHDNIYLFVSIERGFLPLHRHLGDSDHSLILQQSLLSGGRTFFEWYIQHRLKNFIIGDSMAAAPLYEVAGRLGDPNLLTILKPLLPPVSDSLDSRMFISGAIKAHNTELIHSFLEESVIPEWAWRGLCNYALIEADWATFTAVRTEAEWDEDRVLAGCNPALIRINPTFIRELIGHNLGLSEGLIEAAFLMAELPSLQLLLENKCPLPPLLSYFSFPLKTRVAREMLDLLFEAGAVFQSEDNYQNLSLSVETVEYVSARLDLLKERGFVLKSFSEHANAAPLDALEALGRLLPRQGLDVAPLFTHDTLLAAAWLGQDLEALKRARLLPAPTPSFPRYYLLSSLPAFSFAVKSGSLLPDKAQAYLAQANLVHLRWYLSSGLQLGSPYYSALACENVRDQRDVSAVMAQLLTILEFARTNGHPLDVDTKRAIIEVFDSWRDWHWQQLNPVLPNLRHYRAVLKRLGADWLLKASFNK